MRILALALVPALPLSQAAAAQTLRGRVLDAGSGQPVAGGASTGSCQPRVLLDGMEVYAGRQVSSTSPGGGGGAAWPPARPSSTSTT